MFSTFLGPTRAEHNIFVSKSLSLVPHESHGESGGSGGRTHSAIGSGVATQGVGHDEAVFPPGA